MSDTPFVIDPHMTAITLAYRNASLIADIVLPRQAQTPVREFGWNKFGVGTLFTVPDTNVGRRSQPREVNFESDRQTSMVEDYGLDLPIPQSDITQALAAKLASPVDRGVSMVSDLIALDREVRVANQVFALNTYSADKRTTLSGTDQWSDYDDSDPIDDIELALSTPLMRPNVAVFGQVTWSKLRRHPALVKAANRNSGDSGLIRKEDFAELFELEEVVVGSGRVNTAKPGQAPTLARTWGAHAAFIHRNRLADRDSGVTFGMTVEMAGRVAGATPDKNIGVYGGQRVRVAESVKEVIVAADTGYFIQNAVA